MSSRAEVNSCNKDKVYPPSWKHKAGAAAAEQDLSTHSTKGPATGVSIGEAGTEGSAFRFLVLCDDFWDPTALPGVLQGKESFLLRDGSHSPLTHFS